MITECVETTLYVPPFVQAYRDKLKKAAGCKLSGLFDKIERECIVRDVLHQVCEEITATAGDNWAIDSLAYLVTRGWLIEHVGSFGTRYQLSEDLLDLILVHEANPHKAACIRLHKEINEWLRGGRREEQDRPRPGYTPVDAKMLELDVIARLAAARE
jgi:hypothetical protein